MTFELNIKCLWQHPAANNHLMIAGKELSEISDPIVKTAQNLRQLQPGNWKIPVKPRAEELTNLFSALQKITQFFTSKAFIL